DHVDWPQLLQVGRDGELNHRQRPAVEGQLDDLLDDADVVLPPLLGELTWSMTYHTLSLSGQRPTGTGQARCGGRCRPWCGWHTQDASPCGPRAGCNIGWMTWCMGVMSLPLATFSKAARMVLMLAVDDKVSAAGVLDVAERANDVDTFCVLAVI
ncbi:LOW QUALITY PROTEIN: hypothetical protein U9M48_042583, partial [Paspalum notatum var. saurae]